MSVFDNAFTCSLIWCVANLPSFESSFIVLQHPTSRGSVVSLTNVTTPQCLLNTLQHISGADPLAPPVIDHKFLTRSYGEPTLWKSSNKVFIDRRPQGTHGGCSICTKDHEDRASGRDSSRRCSSWTRRANRRTARSVRLCSLMTFF